MSDGWRFASFRLGYVGVGGCTAMSVCATGGLVRLSMFEFSAGLCEGGWLHSHECLCHRALTGGGGGLAADFVPDFVAARFF